MYGKAEYEKKDAPYKIGRRSGRKAEATKKEVPVMSPADTKWTYGTNGEHAGIWEAPFAQPISCSSGRNRGRGGPFLRGGRTSHLCTVEHPFPHLQSRRFADAPLGPFRLGDDSRQQTVDREAEASEEPERGGGNPSQDRETERVCCAVNELLGESFDGFSHGVVSATLVRWEIEQTVV